MDQSFEDAAGRRWTVQLALPDMQRVQKALPGVDLARPFEGELVQRLIVEPTTLVACLTVLLRPQAEAAGVSADELQSALRGDVLDSALQALLGAIVGFFPARQRPGLERAIAKTLELADQRQARVLDLLDGPALARLLDLDLAALEAELRGAAAEARLKPAA